MFTRWGAFVYRFRRIFVVGAVAFALVMAFFGISASSHLSSGGWLDTSSESAAVDERLATEFGGGKSSIIALFRSTTTGGDATPATMRLLGHWNWWAPGPLQRFADRLGFDHVEDPEPALGSGPTLGGAVG